MSLGELVDKVIDLLHCDAPEAFKVAQELYSPDREDYSDDVIEYAATKLGIAASAGEDPVQAPPTPMAEITMDPAEVLREVYLACPRCVPADENDQVHIPVMGRAPQEEQHAIPEELLAELPEHLRVLLLQVDVMNAEMTAVFYDQANGVDRRMPPIDITRFQTSGQMWEALEVLAKRLPKYLAADWN